MSDSDNCVPGYGWRRGALTVALMVAAYPLSVGPVAWALTILCGRGLITEDSMAVYACAYMLPLQVLPAWLQNALEKYIEWCMN